MSASTQCGRQHLGGESYLSHCRTCHFDARHVAAGGFHGPTLPAPSARPADEPWEWGQDGKDIPE